MTGTRSAARDAMGGSVGSPRNGQKHSGWKWNRIISAGCIGPLIAIALVSWFGFDLRSVFLLAIVPGLFAAGMILLLREQPASTPSKATPETTVGRFPNAYWRYLAVTAVFGIGKSSNSFLILRTKDLGGSLTTTVLI